MRTSPLVCGLLVLAGCGPSETPAKPEMPPPIVAVAPPVAQPVRHYEYYTGRTESPETVDVRARVSGYLKKLYFKPGEEVTAGKPLFEIDPDLYAADVARAQAELELGEAKVKQFTADFQRIEKLYNANKSASQEEYDKAVADKLSAEAAIKGYQAKLTTAKLNLGYTKESAPISGIAGDRLVAEGNLVSGGQGGGTTLITTIVSVDDMDVAFDVDENTIQRVGKAVRDKTLKLAKDNEIPVQAGLAVDGTNYPYTGTLNFFDNKVDSKTGTIRLKARFANPKPSVGKRPLVAGMYARVRVPLGEEVPSLLVPEVAIGSDQGTKFIYVLGPQNKAIRLDATLGGREGDLRVIESVRAPGDEKPRPLKPDEQVIVSGLQRMHPGMIVDPKPLKK